MSVMLGHLYTALRAADVPEDKAQKAAEEVAGFESQLNGIRTEMTAIRGDLSLLRWMIGVNTVMVVAIVGRVFLGNH